MQLSVKQKKLGVPVGQTLLGKTVSANFPCFFGGTVVFFHVSYLKLNID